MSVEAWPCGCMRFYPGGFIVCEKHLVTIDGVTYMIPGGHEEAR